MAKLKVKYSDGEQLMLKILRRRKSPISTNDLVELYYKDEVRPFHANQSVMTTLRSLQRKAEINHDDFRIVTSEPRGRAQLHIILEQRKPDNANSV